MSFIRKRLEWSAYVAELLRNLQSSLKRHGLLEKLRYLLYPSRLLPADERAIRRDDADRGLAVAAVLVISKRIGLRAVENELAQSGGRKWLVFTKWAVGGCAKGNWQIITRMRLV